jgi:hypothetical protein
VSEYQVLKDAEACGICTALGYERARNLSFMRVSIMIRLSLCGTAVIAQSVQRWATGWTNGSGAHPASFPMCTRGSFSGGKAAGA